MHSEQVGMTAASRFQRLWMDEVPNLEVDVEDCDRIVYVLDDFVLAFDSVGKVSAEVFEAVICMLKRMAPDAR